MHLYLAAKLAADENHGPRDVGVQAFWNNQVPNDELVVESCDISSVKGIRATIWNSVNRV